MLGAIMVGGNRVPTYLCEAESKAEEESFMRPVAAALVAAAALLATGVGVGVASMVSLR
jgi:hypothetical protein